MMSQQGPMEPAIEIARSLRRNNTAAERKLWRTLHELNASRDLHFRQQAPIGRFVADFCEHTQKLVIEVDGGQRSEPENARRDAERTAWLKSRGYRVIRFSNTEVHTNLEGIMIAIMVATDTLPANSAILPDPNHTAPALTNKAKARRADPRSRKHAHQPPHPSPPPQGGRESDCGRGGLQSADLEILATSTEAHFCVPSPPAGEGQGGGAAAATAGDVLPSKAIAP